MSVSDGWCCAHCWRVGTPLPARTRALARATFYEASYVKPREAHAAQRLTPLAPPAPPLSHGACFQQPLASPVMSRKSIAAPSHPSGGKSSLYGAYRRERKQGIEGDVGC